jgi:hypothetical protein
VVAIAARQPAAIAKVIAVLMIITVALPSLLTSLSSVAISAALEMSQESRDDTGRPNLSRAEFPPGMVLCASTLENSWLPPNNLIGSTSPKVDRGPGDLFAGNSVTPEGLASLEFGAAVLPTKLIMVLGHNSCGAVNATVTALQKGDTLPVHIADLVRAMKPGIEPVLKQSGNDLQQRAVIANMRYNAQRLQHAKPILAENDSQE